MRCCILLFIGKSYSWDLPDPALATSDTHTSLFIYMK